MQPILAARHVMNTRFELLLFGNDEPWLRAAAELALDEIAKIERQISRFLPDSEISFVNREASTRSVKVSPNVFALLRKARELAVITGGFFDPTIGPLVDLMREANATGKRPSRLRLELAKQRIGIDKLELCSADRTVRFRVQGMVLDLGGIGKGFAIDQAVSLLKENGVSSAFIHGGTSTAYGLGNPPDQPGWRVAIADPRSACRDACSTESLVAETVLRDRSLSVSGTRPVIGHDHTGTAACVINPSTCETPATAKLAAIVTTFATNADALSTALLAGEKQCFDLLFRHELVTSALLGLCESPTAPLRIMQRGFCLAGQVNV